MDAILGYGTHSGPPSMRLAILEAENHVTNALSPKIKYSLCQY